MNTWPRADASLTGLSRWSACFGLRLAQLPAVRGDEVESGGYGVASKWRLRCVSPRLIGICGALCSVLRTLTGCMSSAEKMLPVRLDKCLVIVQRVAIVCGYWWLWLLGKEKLSTPYTHTYIHLVAQSMKKTDQPWNSLTVAICPEKFSLACFSSSFLFPDSLFYTKTRLIKVLVFSSRHSITYQILRSPQRTGLSSDCYHSFWLQRMLPCITTKPPFLAPAIPPLGQSPRRDNAASYKFGAVLLSFVPKSGMPFCSCLAKICPRCYTVDLPVAQALYVVVPRCVSTN